MRITNRQERRTYIRERKQTDKYGFTPWYPRHTPRFCLLGLNIETNIDVLVKVIEQKGPKVSTIRVFSSNRDPGKAVIRLNVMADKYSDCVLDHGFWPSYTTCKPWRSRGGTLRMSHTDVYELSKQPRRNITYEGDQVTSDNRYASLCEEMD